MMVRERHDYECVGTLRRHALGVQLLQGLAHEATEHVLHAALHAGQHAVLLGANTGVKCGREAERGEWRIRVEEGGGNEGSGG